MILLTKRSDLMFGLPFTTWLTQLPTGEAKKAPKYEYEPWWGEDGAPPMTELKKPSCPEEIEEQPNPMKKKLKKQAKKAKAKKEKEDAEMPGDIEEKKDEKKEEKKGEDKKKDEKKLAQKPPKAALLFDDV